MSIVRLPTIDKSSGPPWKPGPAASVNLRRISAVKPKTLTLSEGQQVCSIIVAPGGEVEVFDSPDAITSLWEQALGKVGRRRLFAEMSRIAPFNES